MSSWRSHAGAASAATVPPHFAHQEDSNDPTGSNLYYSKEIDSA